MHIIKNKRPLHWRPLVFFKCVIRLGFEPKTHSLEGCCSIQLSYRTINLRRQIY